MKEILKLECLEIDDKSKKPITCLIDFKCCQNILHEIWNSSLNPAPPKRPLIYTQSFDGFFTL